MMQQSGGGRVRGQTQAKEDTLRRTEASRSTGAFFAVTRARAASGKSRRAQKCSGENLSWLIF